MGNVTMEVTQRVEPKVEWQRIADKKPHAIFTHCYGHSLSFAVSDTVENSRLMRNALDTTHEITNLIKFSPQHEAILEIYKG